MYFACKIFLGLQNFYTIRASKFRFFFVVYICTLCTETRPTSSKFRIDQRQLFLNISFFSHIIIIANFCDLLPVFTELIDFFAKNKKLKNDPQRHDIVGHKRIFFYLWKHNTNNNTIILTYNIWLLKKFQKSW